eukprot:GGOE01055192.1.p6 GENE.GGOE01055192.1~~GGOE01055192.1.p6  ORF type:complete len:114 (+),score=14.21 GGOE01055192.1:942-1283(+)
MFLHPDLDDPLLCLLLSSLLETFHRVVGLEWTDLHAIRGENLCAIRRGRIEKPSASIFFYKGPLSHCHDSHLPHPRITRCFPAHCFLSSLCAGGNFSSISQPAWQSVFDCMIV